MPIPSEPEWTFTTNFVQSVPIEFTQDVSIPFEEPTDLEEELEGEEVPENPEVSGQTPVPENEDIYFHSPGGQRIRPGRIVRPRSIVQISVWNLSHERVRIAYAELKEWLVENRFGIASFSHEYMYDDNEQSAFIPYNMFLCDIETEGCTDPSELFSQPPCSCGTELDYPTMACPDCSLNQYCSSCRSFSSNVTNDPEYGAMCDKCSRTCDDCSETYHSSNERCPSCYPVNHCRGCRATIYPTDEGSSFHELTNEETGRINYYCDVCFDCLCHNCHNIVERENIIVDENHQCVTCVSMSNNEEWEESELASDDLSIPVIPGRETIRLVGVEIEGANGEGHSGNDGGNLLAEALYREGLSRSYAMGGYHSGGGRSLVHIERDSSVDWEMVIGPLNVAEPGNVDTLNRSVKVVRNLINDRTLKLDMRAGMHVHVAADRVPFHNAYNLHKLYMYMEDFLYRFGAAKWPYHRSINRRGRDQAGKSPNVEGKLHFARTFSGQRYYGLSFDNYFARYFEQCGCGARTYGLFDECTCDLGKCTFEFRLFNTTANTVKIHAYLAMCQALVAKAIDMEEIKDSTQYPALDFVKSKVSDMHPSTRRKMNRAWEERIVFVNNELPLTAEEKKSIHYCIVNSELGKVATNADILLETEDN